MGGKWHVVGRGWGPWWDGDGDHGGTGMVTMVGWGWCRGWRDDSHNGMVQVMGWGWCPWWDGDALSRTGTVPMVG